MDTGSRFDQTKADAFRKRAINDRQDGYIAIMCSLGDELGLFRALASMGPTTSTELAARGGE